MNIKKTLKNQFFATNLFKEQRPVFINGAPRMMVDSNSGEMLKPNPQTKSVLDELKKHKTTINSIPKYDYHKYQAKDIIKNYLTSKKTKLSKQEAAKAINAINLLVYAQKSKLNQEKKDQYITYILDSFSTGDLPTVKESQASIAEIKEAEKEAVKKEAKQRRKDLASTLPRDAEDNKERKKINRINEEFYDKFVSVDDKLKRRLGNILIDYSINSNDNFSKNLIANKEFLLQVYKGLSNNPKNKEIYIKAVQQYIKIIEKLNGGNENEIEIAKILSVEQLKKLKTLLDKQISEAKYKRSKKPPTSRGATSRPASKPTTKKRAEAKKAPTKGTKAPKEAPKPLTEPEVSIKIVPMQQAKSTPAPDVKISPKLLRLRSRYLSEKSETSLKRNNYLEFNGGSPSLGKLFPNTKTLWIRKKSDTGNFTYYKLEKSGSEFKVVDSQKDDYAKNHDSRYYKKHKRSPFRRVYIYSGDRIYLNKPTVTPPPKLEPVLAPPAPKTPTKASKAKPQQNLTRQQAIAAAQKAERARSQKKRQKSSKLGDAYEAQNYTREMFREEDIETKALKPSTVNEFTTAACRAYSTKVNKLTLNLGDATGKIDTTQLKTKQHWEKLKDRISNYDLILKTLRVPILGIPPNEVKLGQILTKYNGKNLNLWKLDIEYYSEDKPGMGAFGKGRGKFRVKGPLHRQYRNLHRMLASEKSKPKAKQDKQKIRDLKKDIHEVYKGLNALKQVMALFAKMEVRHTANLGAHSEAKKFAMALPKHDVSKNRVYYNFSQTKRTLKEYLPPGEKMPELFESGIIIHASSKALGQLTQKDIENTRKQRLKAMAILFMIYSPQELKPHLARIGDNYTNTSLVLKSVPENFLNNIQKLLKLYDQGVKLSKDLLTKDEDKKGADKARIDTMYEMRLLCAPKKLAALYQLNRAFNFHDRGPAAVKYKWNAFFRKYLPTFQKSDKPITLEEIRAGRINRPSKTISGNFINGRTAFLKIRDRLSPGKEGFEKRLLKKLNEYIRLGIIYEGMSTGITPVRDNQTKLQRLNELTKNYSIDSLRSPLTDQQIDYIRKGFLIEEKEKEAELKLTKLGYTPKNKYALHIAMKIKMALAATKGKNVTDEQVSNMLKLIDQKISAGIGAHVGSVKGKGEGGLGFGINVPLDAGFNVQIGFAVSHKGAAPMAGVSKAFKAGAVDIMMTVSTGGAGVLASIPLEGWNAPVRINAGVGTASIGGALTATLGVSHDTKAAARLEAARRNKQYQAAETQMESMNETDKLKVVKKDTRFKKALSEYNSKKGSEMPAKQQKALASQIYKLTLLYAKSVRQNLDQIDITSNLKIPTLMSFGLTVVGTAPPYIIPYIGIKVADQVVIASAESTSLTAEAKHALLADAARKYPGKRIMIYTQSETLDLSSINFSYDKNGHLKGMVEKRSDSRVKKTMASLAKTQSLEQYNERLSAANITLTRSNLGPNVYSLNANAPEARLAFRISPELQNKVNIVWDNDNVYLAFKPGTHFAITRIDSYYPRKYKGHEKHSEIYIKPTLDWPESVMDQANKGYLMKEKGKTCTLMGPSNSAPGIKNYVNYDPSSLESEQKFNQADYLKAHQAIRRSLAYGLTSRPGAITEARQNQLLNFAKRIYGKSNAKKLTTFQYPFAGFKKIGKGTPDLGKLITYIRKAAKNSPSNSFLGNNKNLSTQEVHIILTYFIHQSFRNLEGYYRGKKNKKEIHGIIKRTLEKSAFPTLRKMFDAHFDEMFSKEELKQTGQTKAQIIEAMLKAIRKQFDKIDFDRPGTAIAAIEAFGSMAGTKGKEGFIIGLRMLRGYESQKTGATKQAKLLNLKYYNLKSSDLGQKAIARFLLVTKSRLEANKAEKLLRSPLAAKVALYAQFLMGPQKTMQLAQMLKDPSKASQHPEVYNEFKTLLLKVRAAQIAGKKAIYFRRNFPVPNSVIVLKLDTKVGYGLYKRCGNLSSVYDAKIKAEIIIPKTAKGSSAATRASSYIKSRAGRMIKDMYMAVSIRYADKPVQAANNIHGGSTNQETGARTKNERTGIGTGNTSTGPKQGGSTTPVTGGGGTNTPGGGSRRR